MKFLGTRDRVLVRWGLINYNFQTSMSLHYWYNEINEEYYTDGRRENWIHYRQWRYIALDKFISSGRLITHMFCFRILLLMLCGAVQLLADIIQLNADMSTGGGNGCLFRQSTYYVFDLAAIRLYVGTHLYFSWGILQIQWVSYSHYRKKQTIVMIDITCIRDLLGIMKYFLVHISRQQPMWVKSRDCI